MVEVQIQEEGRQKEEGTRIGPWHWPPKGEGEQSIRLLLLLRIRHKLQKFPKAFRQHSYPPQQQSVGLHPQPLVPCKSPLSSHPPSPPLSIPLPLPLPLNLTRESGRRGSWRSAGTGRGLSGCSARRRRGSTPQRSGDWRPSASCTGEDETLRESQPARRQWFDAASTAYGDWTLPLWSPD